MDVLMVVFIGYAVGLVFFSALIVVADNIWEWLGVDRDRAYVSILIWPIALCMVVGIVLGNAIVWTTTRGRED